MKTFDPQTTLELEAAAFRRLVRTCANAADVQNIDMMNLAGFCRNCLANWTVDAAKERGLDLSKDEAREIIYGEPYKDWQAKHQKEASADKLAAFERTGRRTSGSNFRHGCGRYRRGSIPPTYAAARPITSVHAFLLAPLAIRGIVPSRE